VALQAMWTHGHGANIELNDRGRGPGDDIGGREWTAVEGLRVGSGVEYRCQDDSDYWFHFAIPTPVIKDDVRMRLRRAMVLFTAGTGVTLSALHVWDGPNRVFVRDGMGIGGSNVSLADDRNAFALPDREVLWGIGISVLFHFADPGSVTLHTAGVDFEA
jgi:hypothetical protein